MAIDFTKPTTTDNHATAFVPGILAHQTALAQWLDSGLTTITGTAPVGAKRYNRTSSAVEEWSGSAWAPILFHGLTFNSGNVGIGTGVVATSKLQIGTGSTSEKIVVKGPAADAEFGNDGTGVRIGTPNNAPVVLVTAAVERVRFPGVGGLWLGRSTDSAFGLLQVADTTGSIADLASSAAGTSIARVRNTGAQVTGLAVQNSATGTTSASGVRLLVDASGVGYLNQEGANSLNFSTNGSTRLSIASTGLVTASVGFAGPGSGITGLNADNLGSGTIPNGRFPATLPSMSGVNLTALNASNLGSGTVPNARTTGTAAATADTLALRDANGDTAVRALTLGNAAVAGNVLNWFEKDVAFTPVVLFNAGSATGWSFTIGARYSRIGNCVFFRFSIAVITVGSATGAVSLQVASFPYAPASVPNVVQYADLQASFSTGLSTGGLRLLMGSSSIIFYNWQASTGNNVNVTDAQMTAGSQWHGSGFYFV